MRKELIKLQMSGQYQDKDKNKLENENRAGKNQRKMDIYCFHSSPAKWHGTRTKKKKKVSQNWENKVSNKKINK